MVELLEPVRTEEASETSNLSSEGRALKKKIVDYIASLGFDIKEDGSFELTSDRDSFRLVQQRAWLEKIEQNNDFLRKELPEARRYSKDGRSIDPQKIDLSIRQVAPNTLEERLFRWWNIVWWSIPYQRSYGRRLRFLLWDDGHNIPFGLICLHSAPLKMAVRDNALGITKGERDWWVNMSLSAQRVGALPPYNQLLGGKMVGLALTSNEVRESYRERYSGKVSLLLERELPANLLFVTTTGAFGRTSIYNRLKYQEEQVAQFIGYTRGSGSFHIPDGLFKDIVLVLDKNKVDVTGGYGRGPSRKRQLMNIASRMLNLPSFEYHGIERAFYVFSNVANLNEVITHEAIPKWHDRPFSGLASFWKRRWALPRATRTDEWQNFKTDDFFDSTTLLLKNLANATE